MKDYEWKTLSELQEPIIGVVITMMKNGRVFAYDSDYTMAGLKNVIEHHPEAPCLLVQKPGKEPASPPTPEGKPGEVVEAADQDELWQELDKLFWEIKWEEDMENFTIANKLMQQRKSKFIIIRNG